MNKSELFNRIRTDLTDKIHFLKDKPEETPETTLRSLWLTASGMPVSAEGSLAYPLPELSDEQVSQLYHMVDLRIKNTPLAYITGRQRFMGLDMLTDKRALIPRRETEILGKKALEIADNITSVKGKIRVIDACCGSGNLGLALACLNKKCEILASDLSDEAVALAKENAGFLGLNDRMQVIQGDLLSAFEAEDNWGKIDLIVCNPPYILSSNVSKMDIEISSNEPALAFDGGMLGIRIIQRLISEAPKFLTSDGWLVFEVGVGQGDFVTKLCERSGSYKNIHNVADDAGNIRVIEAQKS